ncbi:MAG TPA: glucokinase [Burkholderiales bacterium]
MARTRLVLAGDIGGTKTLLRLSECGEGRCEALEERRYENADFQDFRSLLDDFLGGPGVAPEAGCFACAAPIAGRSVRLTNLDWVIDADHISSGFNIPRVSLVNDFEAVALGMSGLGEGDLATLQPGRPAERGPRVVLGAGTGLGVAWLVWTGAAWLPIATEAGHMDFAPAGESQRKLARRLERKFGHVSWERVLSGSGLVELFGFIDEECTDPPRGLGATGAGQDPAARITELALGHSHPGAEQALDLFVHLYGACAGNLALAGLTRGGVYLAGGIAPRILSRLREDGFLEAFRAKGRFAPLMAEFPVHVVIHPAPGLVGATLAAAEL